jgi:hypothetical protein
MNGCMIQGESLTKLIAILKPKEAVMTQSAFDYLLEISMNPIAFSAMVEQIERISELTEEEKSKRLAQFKTFFEERATWPGDEEGQKIFDAIKNFNDNQKAVLDNPRVKY